MSEINLEFCKELYQAILAPQTGTRNLNAVQFVHKLLQYHAPVSYLVIAINVTSGLFTLRRSLHKERVDELHASCVARGALHFRATFCELP